MVASNMTPNLNITYMPLNKYFQNTFNSCEADVVHVNETTTLHNYDAKTTSVKTIQLLLTKDGTQSVIPHI